MNGNVLKVKTSKVFSVGNYLYFSSITFNGFLRYDMVSERTELLKQFNGSHLWTEKLYMQGDVIKDTMFFFPFSGNGVAAFNYADDSMEIIPGNQKHYINHIKTSDNVIYVFPCDGKCPLIKIEYNDSYNVMYLNDWNSKLYRQIKGDFGINACVNVDDSTFVTIVGNNNNRIFNIECDTFEANEVLLNGISNPEIIDSNDKFLWISDEKHCLHKLDKEKYEIFSLNLPDEEMKASRIVKIDERKYVILSANNSYICICENDEIIKIINLSDFENFYIDGSDRIRNFVVFYEYVVLKNELWLMPHSGNAIVIINLDDYSVYCKEIPFPDEFDGELIEKYEKIQNSLIGDGSGLFFRECKEGMGLNTFLKDICCV